MFWESQRGHFGIRGNVQDSGHLNALDVRWSAVLPGLRRVRGRTCENGVYLSNPHVAMAELHVTLPHFGVVERHQRTAAECRSSIVPGRTR